MPITIPELFQIRDVIETAVAGVLSTATGATALVTQDSTDKTTPRIEVSHDQGNSIGHKYIYSGNAYDDIFKGSLTVRYITNRNTSGAPANHATARGKIEAALIPGVGNFTLTNLPYHHLVDLRQKSAQFHADDAEDQDTTELVYDAVCGIRVEGWEAVG